MPDGSLAGVLWKIGSEPSIPEDRKGGYVTRGKSLVHGWQPEIPGHFSLPLVVFYLSGHFEDRSG